MKLIDLHCDTIEECWKQNKALYSNDLHLSLERGREFQPWAQFFAVWIPDNYRGQSAADLFDRVYERFLSELEQNRDRIVHCRNGRDFDAAERQRKIGAFLTLEGGAALMGQLEQIKRMADLGVTAITLTWNDSNEIGDGAMVKNPAGLTEFGKQAVREMERQGVLIDISHASEPLFWSVVEHTEKPFLATHSNSKQVTDHPRNLTDEQFLTVCRRGGLVGLNLCTAFLRVPGVADMDDMVRHADHFLALGGEKNLALGSDFDGISELPDGMTGVESIEALAEYFLRRNYPASLIDGIFYENARNFLNFL